MALLFSEVYLNFEIPSDDYKGSTKNLSKKSRAIADPASKVRGEATLHRGRRS
jgi:hypothetical protein